MKRNNNKKHLLGKNDAVSLKKLLTRRIYIYKCPECFYKEKVTNLRKHLEMKHQWSKEEAKLEETRRRTIFQWSQGSKHQKHLPLPCKLCSIWVHRLDHHLKRHKRITEPEKKRILVDTKMEYWPWKAKMKKQDNKIQV